VNDEHLKYEIMMLQVTLLFLRAKFGVQMMSTPIPTTDEINWPMLLFNIMHESFCVHANNLKQWIIQTNSSLDYPFSVDERLRFDKIDDQVLTLTEARTADISLKLGNDDREQIFQTLKRELASRRVWVQFG